MTITKALQSKLLPLLKPSSAPSNLSLIMELFDAFEELVKEVETADDMWSALGIAPPSNIDELRAVFVDHPVSGHLILTLMGSLAGLGVEWCNVSSLDLSRYIDWGPVPPLIGRMSNLRTLDLIRTKDGTQSFDSFPPSLSQLKVQSLSFQSLDFKKLKEFIESWTELQEVFFFTHYRESDDDAEYLTWRIQNILD